MQVAITGDRLTADLLAEQLAEAGIRSLVRDLAGTSMYTGPLAGTYDVHVLEGDAALASQILGGPPPEALPPPAIEPPRERRKRRRWWR